MEKALSIIGAPFRRFLEALGDFIRFTLEVLRWSWRPPYRISLILREMERIGVNSFLIIALVSLFAGMVFSLQTGSAFRSLNAETLVGSTVGIALTRELAPVFTALMVVARAGSAMAAEIGTMQVSEQVDALKTMAIQPVQYLVVPKVIASTLATPLLTGLFNGIGLFGSYIVAIYLLRIPEGPYLEHFRQIVDPVDLYQGLIKAVVFGFLLSLIACYYGYRTKNGAVGVGQATTKAVVAASVMVLISDYFLAMWLLEILPS